MSRTPSPDAPRPLRGPRTPEGPILAIDLGLKRTGLARSDPSRAVAIGLPTFDAAPHRSLKKHILALHHEVPLGGVVIGLPLHMDGREGDLVGRVRRLAAWIRTEIGLPVALLDERLTSEAAADLLAEAPARVRRAKGVRDRLAAQILLQEFLAAGCVFPEEP